jgi:catechol 2,3-dioxygenase-like lactoylglutathione lyase family enzyme
MFKKNKKTATYSRRKVLGALSLVAGIPVMNSTGFALSKKNPSSKYKLHSFELRVSDVSRSVKFYSDVLGVAIVEESSESATLRLGDGPSYFSLRKSGIEESSGFEHIGISVLGFDAAELRLTLVENGFSELKSFDRGDSRLSRAKKYWVNTYDSKGVWFADAEGIVFKLQPRNDCGASSCSSATARSDEALFSAEEINHFTNFSSDNSLANSLLNSILGSSFQAYQGPTSPIIGVGDGRQFLMYAGVHSPTTVIRAAMIDHVCFSISENFSKFDVEKILGLLESYGLTKKGQQTLRGSSPLEYWVSQRMPNRGGVEGGTPEIYFSDPDGNRIQVQAPAYCGGGGYLGEQCPKLN